MSVLTPDGSLTTLGFCLCAAAAALLLLVAGVISRRKKKTVAAPRAVIKKVNVVPARAQNSIGINSFKYVACPTKGLD